MNKRIIGTFIAAVILVVALIGVTVNYIQLSDKYTKALNRMAELERELEAPKITTIPAPTIKATATPTKTPTPTKTLTPTPTETPTPEPTVEVVEIVEPEVEEIVEEYYEEEYVEEEYYEESAAEAYEEPEVQEEYYEEPEPEEYYEEPAANTSEYLYNITDLSRAGIINYNGYRFTWYTSNEWTGNPAYGKPEGSWVDENGCWRDPDGYLMLASDSLAPYSVVDTPFGLQGKIYDCGPGADDILDVYTAW